jgi:hypothetical protein
LKRALIVAPHFAPINAPDGHRVRLNLPHYRKNGWAVEVLAVRAKHRPDWTDESLAESLPAEVPIHRCGAVPLRLARLAGVGTMGWRALPFLAARGSALLARGKFDLVVFSTTQFNALNLGPCWRTVFGVPFVVDLQDPWHNDYYDQPGAPRPPGGWKYRVARLLSGWQEPRCFRAAAGFTMVSEDYRTLLEKRYPWFRGKPAATVPFAAPVDDFAGIAAEQRGTPPSLCRCVGALNPAFRSSLRAFFSMAAQARKADPAGFAWHFEFIGTSYAGEGRKAETLALEEARAQGMEDVARESTDRVPYRESLRLMRGADLLLVLGSDDPKYTPSRLATLVAAGRPVLAVGTRESRLLARAATFPGVTCVETDGAGRIDFGKLQEIPRLPEEYRPEKLAARECALWDRAVAGGG